MNISSSTSNYSTSYTYTSDPNYYYPFAYYHTSYNYLIPRIQVWVSRVIPAITCPIGIIGNVLIISVFTLRDCGMSKSAKFYYVMIASMDLTTLMSFHLFEYIGFMVPNAEQILILPANDLISCKISRWLWITSVQGSGFTTVIRS